MAMPLTTGAVAPASIASARARGHVARTPPSRGVSPTHSGEHFGSVRNPPPRVAPHVRPIIAGPLSRSGTLLEYFTVAELPNQIAPVSRTARAPRYSQSV